MRRCRRPTARWARAVPKRSDDRRGPRRRAVRRRVPPVRPGARRHGVRPLLPELPQPPAADQREDRHGQRAVRAATTPRPPTTSSSTPKTSSSSARSFNTQLGRTGIALQGEVSHRWDVPLQVDDVELLYAALTPLRLLPPLPQLAPAHRPRQPAGEPEPGWAPTASRSRSTGYRRFDTTQVQMTGTKAFSQVLGADQVVLVAEGAWSTVHDLPDQKCSGSTGPAPTPAATRSSRPPASSRAPSPRRRSRRSSAWGYVLAGPLRVQQRVRRGDRWSPRFSFAQDVAGISPGPGGNFLEGRKSLTLGLGFQYRINWELDLSYTTLLRGGPLQPDQRPRLRRGQHQVFLLRQSPCAARHDSSRPSPSS